MRRRLVYALATLTPEQIEASTEKGNEFVSDLKDKPKHLEVRVDADRVLVHVPKPIECAKCRKMAYFFVNQSGVTVCSTCHHERPAT